MKETLKNLCYSFGWSYAVFWGFDQTNSLLLTLKDCYYEEQMETLIDSMLLQAHAVGGGIIGQTAIEKNHLWLDSDAFHERRNSVVSFDSHDISQDDSEFFCQFSIGIKTIAVISVEPWGVVELGSTHKNPEMKSFVEQVQQVFREMDGIEGVGNETQLDSHFFDSSNMLFDSSLSNGIFHSENLMGADLLLESANFLDFSDYGDCSTLTSSWPHPTSLPEPIDEESCKDSISNAPLILSRDSNAQDYTSSIITPTEKLSGLLTVEEYFGLYSPHSNASTKGSRLSGTTSTSVPTNSLQSSATNALRSSDDAKCSMGVEAVRKNPVVWTGSDCISQKNVGSNSNSLFSKFGLDQLLDTSSPCSFEDQLSSAAKRRRTGNFSWSPSQVKHVGEMKSYNPEAKNSLVSKEPRSCVDDSCSLVASTSRRHEEQVRTKKKKAKPGSKSRPKDRQMIQDRLGELRELIPNGEKMSIDRLLERTIRHLNFMQSLKGYAETLKQIAKPKKRSCHTWGREAELPWVGGRIIELPKRYSRTDGGVGRPRPTLWVCRCVYLY
ncbi:transcription factor bHLH157-like isoform X2 [Salvia splendens]|uniref:transcription factor bHLH157-like isoform X2 n=1 Tax=Salvia splendens TaxID=180675 RepID=UPI001C26917B|nr:transcription factor bHLH157-like isoform X2 [Salvia splendens]